MFILEIDFLGYATLEDGKREKLDALLASKKGVLVMTKGNDRKEKVITSLNLSGMGQTDILSESLLGVQWDMVSGDANLLRHFKDRIKTGKLVQQLDFPEDGVSEDVNVREWWEKQDIMPEADVIEILLNDGFSNLRQMQRLCRRDKRVRLVGGVILALPSLELKVGRKDSKNWGMYDKDSGYDSLKPINLNEDGVLDRMSRFEGTIRAGGKGTGKSQGGGRGTSGKGKSKPKTRVGFQSGGKVAF